MTEGTDGGSDDHPTREGCEPHGLPWREVDTRRAIPRLVLGEVRAAHPRPQMIATDPISMGPGLVELREPFTRDTVVRVAERTHELERKERVLGGLRDLLAALNSHRPLCEMLEYIIVKAGELMGTSSGAIFSLAEGDHTLSIQAARDLPLGYVARRRLAADEGVMGQAIDSQQAVTLTYASELLTDGTLKLDEEQRSLLETLASRYKSLLTVPLVVKGRVYGALVLYYRDARRFSAEDRELAATFADHAALAIENARLLEQVEQAAASAERDRLARDLHDSVTQTLFSASIVAEVLPRLWERDPEAAHGRLEELRQLTKGALAEMRTLLLELRPQTLTQAPLTELLRQLAEAASGRGRLPIHVSVEGEYTLPPDTQIALYRIAQEALNNVARHAQASEAHVHLKVERGKVELTIRDDGRGFDPTRVPPGHLGLHIMRERAEAIGGSLQIESCLRQGTQVLVTWLAGGEAVEKEEAGR